MRSIKLPSWIERFAGLDPRPLPPFVFGIDEDEVRMACVEGPRNVSTARRLPEVSEMVISEWASRDLSPETWLEGPLGGTVRDIVVLAQQLRELLEQRTDQATPVLKATLVLPDPWLRMVITEAGGLPRRGKARAEALQWTLRRLVPFRVDELRSRVLELGPLTPGGPSRLAFAFGIDHLLSQLEQAFARVGVHIGHITADSLAASDLLSAAPEGVIVTLVTVRRGGYTILLLRNDEPLLYRHKALPPSRPGQAPSATVARLVQREVALTRAFLEQHLESCELADARLVAAPENLEPWAEWLARGLGVAAAPLETPWGSHAGAGLFAASGGAGMLHPLVGSLLGGVR